MLVEQVCNKTLTLDIKTDMLNKITQITALILRVKVL